MEWTFWCTPASYRACPAGTDLYIYRLSTWVIARSGNEFRLADSDTSDKWVEMQVLDVHTFKEACALAEVILRMRGEL